MTTEKPKPFIVRLYKKERKAIEKYAKECDISKAEAIRRALIHTFGIL